MSRKRLGVVIVLAVVAALGGTLAARWSNRHAQSAPPLNPEQPALTVDPAHLDFGTVWETERFEWAAPVRNNTGSPLRAAALGSSCACVANGPTGSTSLIPPGETASHTFVLDLRQQCIGVEPQAVRDFKVRVTLGGDTSSAEKPTTVELRGRVKSAIVVPAKSIDFGRLSAVSALKPRVVPVRSLVGLRELNVSVDGTGVTTELKSLAADRWELHVSPTTPLLIGRHEAKVHLAPTTTSGEKVPPTTIPVAFDVLHDIQPDTSLVVLGTGKPGEVLRGSLTVSSLSGRPFVRPTCTAEGVTVRPSGDGAKPVVSWTFDLEVTASKTGNHVVPVVVRGVSADGLPFEFRTEAQWYGVTP